MFTNAFSSINFARQVGGLTLEINAINPNGDNTQPADLSTMSSVIDLSGFHRICTQGTGINQPVFTKNVVNGLPGIAVNNDDYFSLPSSTFPTGAGQYSIFALVQSTGGVSGAGRNIFFGGSQLTNQGILLRHMTNNTLNTSWWANNLTSADNAWAANVPALVETHFDGTGRSQFVNGTAAGNDSQTAKNTATSPHVLGAGWNNTSGLVGYIFHFLLFNRYLSSAEKTFIRSGIKNLWGVTVV